MHSAIITLMTDFGSRDPYVGVMKGVILGIQPTASIIDLGHELKSFDIIQAGFLLSSAYEYFPAWTIHVVVVDPGVGGSRAPLLVTTSDRYFIAPDNGILSPIYMQHPECTVRAITSDHYFLRKKGATFDGRDVFAPCAAWMSRLRDASLFGDEIEDYERLDIPRARQEGRALIGSVIHTDSFGNLISNIPSTLIEDAMTMLGTDNPQVQIDQKDVGALTNAYCDRPKGEAVAVIGGTGFLEVAINQGNACQELGCQVGSSIKMLF